MGRKLENAKALYIEGILEGRYEDAINAYSGERYTQHSTGVADGRAGFIEFFAGFTERNPIRDIRVVRGWEDGNYVFIHVYQSLNEGEFEYVTTDFWDTDSNDKLIEHWDVISVFGGRTPSGHTPLDGPTEVTDLDKTESNKAVVRALIENVLMRGGTPENIDRYISAEQYIQHNPAVADGVDAFRSLVTSPTRHLWYEEIVLVVGQGNFVATLCRSTWERNETDNVEQAHVDIFRLEGGLIVEHWDNVEPVPKHDVNAGKF